MSVFLQFTRTGKPLEVLELQHRELPPLKPNEVRVAMRYAPINPADLNFIEGNYGRAANPPAIPGHEGCGEVLEIGDDVTSLAKGDAVIPLHPGGIWCQHMTAPEGWFAKLPETIDPVQASMLRVNPVTAWRLLHDFVNLSEGDWIAQNAANSGVGIATIHIAKKLGLRTINFVRRPELVDELQALGADAVFLDDDDGLAAAKALVGKAAPRLAANAVGGDSALRLMDLTAPHATLVTYGAMSRRSLKVPNKFLIFKDLTLRGLWVSQWYEQASHAEIQDVLRPLAGMMMDGSLILPVDQVVPLSNFPQAIERAQAGARSGKVILDLASAG
jgi:trans-2-enoyl-CoA reductase